MPRDGSATRTRLMDAAEGLMLERGFAGTSVDEVIGMAGVTKGAFFHHFPTKQDLARALMERYARLDLDVLESTLAAAEAAADDPLEQVLEFLRRYEQLFAELDEPYPGCLMASYIGQTDLIDDDVLGIAEQTMRTWRRRLRAKLDEVAQVHTPVREVDLDDLADAVTVVVEGAFVVSRTLQEARVTAAQLAVHRELVAALFGAGRTDRP